MSAGEWFTAIGSTIIVGLVLVAAIAAFELDRRVALPKSPTVVEVEPSASWSCDHCAHEAELEDLADQAERESR